MKHAVPFCLAIVLWLFAGGTAVLAFGESEDCCSALPEEFESQGLELEESFRVTDPDKLRTQRAMGILCQIHPCGVISEDAAREILDNLDDSDRRTQDVLFASLSTLVGALGLILAGIGVGISWVSLKRSSRNEEQIGEINGRLEQESRRL